MCLEEENLRYTCDVHSYLYLNLGSVVNKIIGIPFSVIITIS